MLATIAIVLWGVARTCVGIPHRAPAAKTRWAVRTMGTRGY